MVSPPMLVSGRKFDIGTYVVVTSGEPFRVGVEYMMKFFLLLTLMCHLLPRSEFMY